MALTRDDNPFVPGFGVVPPALAGREPEFADLGAALRRVRRGVYEQPRLLSGDRGLGKTAVVAELVADARNQGVWAVDVEATRTGDALVPLLRDLHRTLLAHDREARIGEHVRRALSVLAAFALRHGGVHVAVDVRPSRRRGGSGDLATDLGDVLEAIGEAAMRARTALLLAVDEIHVLPPPQMGALFAALQRAARREVEPGVHLPVLAVVAGLPHSLAVMRAASSTYAERVREHELGLLAAGAVVEALTVPAVAHGVRFAPDALSTLVEAIGGYPYFVQLMGYETWNAAADRGARSVVSRADAEAGVVAGRLAADRIYRSRLAEVPDAERHYLQAVARLDAGQRRSGAIAELLGGTAQEWGWARRRLIDRGLLRPDGHGQVTFALPGLERFLRDAPRG